MDRAYASAVVCIATVRVAGGSPLERVLHAVRVRVCGEPGAYAAHRPDNVFIERLWRSVKYEDVYLRDYADGHALHAGLERYFRFYNNERPHSALGNRTPATYHNSN